MSNASILHDQDDGLTVTGDEIHQVHVTINAADISASGTLRWAIWDIPDSPVRTPPAKGTLDIQSISQVPPD